MYIGKKDLLPEVYSKTFDNLPECFKNEALTFFQNFSPGKHAL